MMNHQVKKKKGVKEILLMGIFWRILFIEGVLLFYSLGYSWYVEGSSTMELFWYSVRITVLVAIIITFMMITLKKFLSEKIIKPLEAIASANVMYKEDVTNLHQVDPIGNVPNEIETIIKTRSEMLKTVLDVSKERLKLSTALKDELERGRKIQKDFLPNKIPVVQNCQIEVFFKSALELSGDFYDVFRLPNNHIGFVVGDVSGKGVGSALFMSLVRSLVRVFSGAFNTNNNFGNFEHINRVLSPEDALKSVSLTNEYIFKEHGEDCMFVTLVFGIINIKTGQLFYINAGHEPLLIIGKKGIKKAIKATGPAIGPIPDAEYTIGSFQLEKGDFIFAYTDGVTEARCESKGFYGRKRLEKNINHGFISTARSFMDTVTSDLFAFIGDAPQSDDITMLVLRWDG